MSSNNDKQHFENKILARNIKEFRDEQKLTYQEIAEAIDVDKSFLSRVVNLTSNVSMPLLIRLAEYMGVPVYSLFVPSSEMVQEEFLERINTQIITRKLTPEMISKITGLSPLRVIEILSGKSIISPTEYDKLSDGLGVNMKPYHRNNLLLIERLIKNLDIPETAKESIIIYIEDNRTS